MYVSYKRHTLDPKTQIKFKVKRWKKICHANNDINSICEEAILISYPCNTSQSLWIGNLALS